MNRDERKARPGASRLPGAPLAHRALHQVGRRGIVGVPSMWRAVEAIRALPPLARWSPAPGADVRLTLTDREQLAESALYRGTFEWAEMSIVERLVKPGDLCVDVGANVGIYTALLAALTGPTGRVIACEPSPVALARLRELDHPAIEIRDVAVGRAEGELVMTVAPGDSMHSTLREHHRPEGERHTVVVQPLPAILGPHDRPAFVKIDVEGFEAEVVEGMLPLLEERRIRAAMFEVEPDYGSIDWVSELAQLPGYELRRLTVSRRGVRWRARLEPVAGSSTAGTVFLTAR